MVYSSEFTFNRVHLYTLAEACRNGATPDAPAKAEGGMMPPLPFVCA